MTTTLKAEVKQNTLTNTIYSVGIDERLNLKEQIVKKHGIDSDVSNAINQLDDFLGAHNKEQYDTAVRLRNEAESILNISTTANERKKVQTMFNRADKILAFENRPEVKRFARSVRKQVNTSEVDTVTIAVINDGYIETLKRLSANNAPKEVAFAKDYAREHNTTIAQVLLFGPNGSAYYALVNWIVQERTHGMRRPGRQPHPLWKEDTKKAWMDANRTCNLPVGKDDSPFDIDSDNSYLSEQLIDKISQRWRSSPALGCYTGTNRLSGDMPYQIIEDVVDMMITIGSSLLSQTQRYRYDGIVEQANRKGIDSFLMVYKNLFDNKNKLRSYWDRARKLLFDYSLLLWETQNEVWLADGKRIPAAGVVYKPAKLSTREAYPSKKIPGTIYLNNGRYYWVVARKMGPRPLIDPKSKPKVPGTIFKDGSRYYWFIPGLLKRQRLVPDGEKFSASDRVVAEKVALKKWKQLQKDAPAQAVKILKHTRSQGLATKDKKLAEEIALNMWNDIQKNNPQLMAKILSDNRRKPKGHWYAHIKVEGKLRFIGSFKTKERAEAAYRKEFEKIYGYPAGYNIQCIPKIDKVWPAWTEEKSRLDLMDDKPRMTVIGKAESLEPMVQNMQKIDWLAENCMLVFEDDQPTASEAIAVGSRGQRWYGEIKKSAKRTVIRGSASIDRETGRVKITLYGNHAGQKRVLTEEIYHIVFEIIKNASPKTFSSIRKWYRAQLQKDIDPTWQIHEAFAELMAQETQSPDSTNLPDNVVRYAKRVFSDRNSVPESAMEMVMAVA